MFCAESPEVQPPPVQLLEIVEIKKASGCKRVRDLVKIDDRVRKLYSHYDIDLSIDFESINNHVDEDGIISPIYNSNTNVEEEVARIQEVTRYIVAEIEFLHESVERRLDFIVEDGVPLSVLKLIWTYNRTLLVEIMRNKGKRSSYITFLAAKYLYADIAFLSTLNGSDLGLRIKVFSINMSHYIDVFDEQIYQYLSTLGDKFVLKDLRKELITTQMHHDGAMLYRIARNTLSIDKLVSLVDELVTLGSVDYSNMINKLWESDLDYYIGHKYADSSSRVSRWDISIVNRLHYTQKKHPELVIDASTILTAKQAVTFGLTPYPSKKDVMNGYIRGSRQTLNNHVIYKSMKYGPTMRLEHDYVARIYLTYVDNPCINEIMEMFKRHYVHVDQSIRCDLHQLMECIVDSISPKLLEYHTNTCEKDNCFFMGIRSRKTKNARR